MITIANTDERDKKDDMRFMSPCNHAGAFMQGHSRAPVLHRIALIHAALTKEIPLKPAMESNTICCFGNEFGTPAVTKQERQTYIK
jgi:hypothetical protein